MIWVTFTPINGGELYNKPCAETPQKGDSVQLDGRLWEVKHRRWVENIDYGSNELMPEIVIE